MDCLLSLNNKDQINAEIVLKPSVDVYHATSRFLSLFKEKSTAYSERLEHLCRYLLASLESENPKLSYIGVALNKDHSIAWIRHIKLLLYRCCTCMEKLKPGKLYYHRFSLFIRYVAPVSYMKNHLFCFIFIIILIDTHSDSLTLSMYLHTLVSFTSPNTWALLKVKSLTALKPGMSQLCSNVLGALVQKGFFITLRVSERFYRNAIELQTKYYYFFSL